MLWFTGLSGSGKSTIARRVAAELRRQGRRVEYLDGDLIREIFPATGFTRAERDAHIRRVGWLASRLEHHGVIVVASLVSPYGVPQFVRGLCRRFLEIWVSTPFEECERRDVKGLYARARRGEPELHRARRSLRAAGTAGTHHGYDRPGHRRRRQPSAGIGRAMSDEL